MFKLLNSGSNLSRQKYHCLENWFIHAKPNNRLVRLYRDILLEYWKHENGQNTYLLSYSAITCVIKNDNMCNWMYQNMPNYKEQFLFRKYLKCDYSEHIYNILSNSENVP